MTKLNASSDIRANRDRILAAARKRKSGGENDAEGI